MIQISIQAETREELVAQVTELFSLITYSSVEEVNRQLKEESEPAPKAKKTKAEPKAEPKEEPKPEPAPEPEAPAQPVITMDEAKAKVADYIRANGNAKVKTVLDTLGVDKVSFIPEDKLPLALDMLGIAYE